LGREIQIKLDDPIIFQFTKGESHRRRSATPQFSRGSTFERNGTTERELRDCARENRVRTTFDSTPISIDGGWSERPGASSAHRTMRHNCGHDGGAAAHRT
jgi:hypothetical protein